MSLPNRLTELLRQKETQLTLSGLCLALFNWPFIEIYCSGDVLTAVSHIFIVWGIAIALLFFVSMSCKDSPSDGLNQERKDH